jgi:plasmid stabilization system protein ParE
MKVSYRDAASDDVVRQFRYYLVTLSLPEIATRFKESVRSTIRSLCKNPHLGPHYQTSNPQLQNLRSWPVVRFEAIRIYYLVEQDTLHVIRILHSKRDVKRIIEQEEAQ